MSNYKIFVLVPNTYRMGGIANYYKVIKRYSKSILVYISRGSQKQNESRITVIFRLLKDYLKFCRKTWFREGTLLVNTSLGYGGFLRDGIYLLLSSPKRSRVVFFHGWDLDFEKSIDSSVFRKIWLNITFLKADHLIVLSSTFKQKLREWKYEKPISIETTHVDEELIDNGSWKSILKYREQRGVPHILYLGSMLKLKGLWEIAEALKVLKSAKVLHNVNITLAGDGQEKNGLMRYTKKNNIEVSFPGYVRGQKKAKEFKQATIFVFASYTEGMPTSVLEAMAFGLPVITTLVGGIEDFFEEGKMGLVLENRKPEQIAQKIKYLLAHPQLVKKMSRYNYNYAKKNFYVSKVAARMDKILLELQQKSRQPVK